MTFPERALRVKTLGDLGDSPAKGQAMPVEETVERREDDKVEDLMPSTSGMSAELQEWCLLPEVAFPFAHLDASDGSILPLTVNEMEQLKNHIKSGHLNKSRSPPSMALNLIWSPGTPPS